MVQFPSTWDPLRGGRIPIPVIWEMFGAYSPRAQPVLDFHVSTARYRIITAPARTSKSFSAAKDALYYCLPDWIVDGAHRYPVPVRENDHRRIWSVGVDYSTNKEFFYLYEDLVESGVVEMLVKDTGGKIERARANSKQGDMEIVIDWGKSVDGRTVKTIVQGKSSKIPETLKGEQVDYAVMSESSEHDQEIFSRYLKTRCHKVVMPTTPQASAQWLKEMIDDAAVNPDLGIECFRFTPHCNPTYDWELFWLSHAQSESINPKSRGQVITKPFGHDCFDPDVQCWAMEVPAFGEQFGGLFTYSRGRVLPFHSRETLGVSHVIHRLPDWWANAKKYVSCDWGHTDPAAAGWWAVAPDETVLLYREIYEAGMDLEDFIRRMKEFSVGEEIDYFVGDPKKPEVASLMRKFGLPVQDRNKSAMASRAAGHAKLISMLAVDPAINRPKLFVLSDVADGFYEKKFGCPNIIREWEVLHYKENWFGEEWSDTGFSKGSRDEGYDLARYFLMSGYSAPPAKKSIRQWMKKHGVTPAMQRKIVGGRRPSDMIGPGVVYGRG